MPVDGSAIPDRGALTPDRLGLLGVRLRSRLRRVLPDPDPRLVLVAAQLRRAAEQRADLNLLAWALQTLSLGLMCSAPGEASRLRLGPRLVLGKREPSAARADRLVDLSEVVAELALDDARAAPRLPSLVEILIQVGVVAARHAGLGDAGREPALLVLRR